MKLFYKEYGDGQPVVLLHGLLGSFENWYTIAKSLAENHRVIVPDLRNHGRSPRSDNFDYTALSTDLRELVNTLKLKNPVLVGHSMGGKTAMEFALRFPDLPKAIVIEDMVPGRTTPITGAYIEMLLKLDLVSAGYRRDLEDELFKKIGDRRVVLFLLKNLSRNSDGSFSWRSNLQALTENYDSLWKGLRSGRSWDGPALFIRGGQSAIVADDRFEEIFDFFPRAKIVTIDNATHWVHFDAAEEFIGHIEGFLRGPVDGVV